MENMNKQTKDKKLTGYKKLWKKPSLMILNKSFTEGGYDPEVPEDTFGVS